jgi:hypothetical protein
MEGPLGKWATFSVPLWHGSGWDTCAAGVSEGVGDTVVAAMCEAVGFVRNAAGVGLVSFEIVPEGNVAR